MMLWRGCPRGANPDPTCRGGAPVNGQLVQRKRGKWLHHIRLVGQVQRQSNRGLHRRVQQRRVQNVIVGRFRHLIG